MTTAICGWPSRIITDYYHHRHHRLFTHKISTKTYEEQRYKNVQEHETIRTAMNMRKLKRNTTMKEFKYTHIIPHLAYMFTLFLLCSFMFYLTEDRLQIR